MSSLILLHLGRAPDDPDLAEVYFPAGSFAFGPHRAGGSSVWHPANANEDWRVIEPPEEIAYLCQQAGVLTFGENKGARLKEAERALGAQDDGARGAQLRSLLSLLRAAGGYVIASYDSDARMPYLTEAHARQLVGQINDWLHAER